VLADPSLTKSNSVDPRDPNEVGVPSRWRYEVGQTQRKADFGDIADNPYVKRPLDALQTAATGQLERDYRHATGGEVAAGVVAGAAIAGGAITGAAATKDTTDLPLVSGVKPSLKLSDTVKIGIGANCVRCTP